MERLPIIPSVIFRLAVLSVAIAAACAMGFRPSQTRLQGQQPLPVTYICPMSEHSDVIEDTPGKKCPRCDMDLVPVILDLAWSCPVHPVVLTDRAGRCPLDKRELVQVTISRYWTCPDRPKEHVTSPGTCANGTARTLVREHRAHGDHNPKHGGQLFMASDKWHHIEATYPSAGVVRVLVYDNFTQPMSVSEFSGRAVTREEFDAASGRTRDLDAFPLRRARDGKSFEGRIGNRPLPARVTIKMKFSERGPEERFDFAFEAYSKQPVSPSAVTGKPPSPPVPQAPAPVPSTMNATPTPFDPLSLAGPLPSGLGDLLKLLAQRDQEVAALIHAGQFGVVYVPAIQAKEVALALEAHVSGLSDRHRLEAIAATKLVVLKAWELDAYGDLGDAQKVAQAHAGFAAAVKNVQDAYASR